MNPADLALPVISPSLTTKGLPLSTSLPQKTGKAPVPRVDVEPIYTQLKGALGDQWVEYKAAINAFVLGNLNQAELSWVLQPLLCSVPPLTTSTNSAAPPLSIVILHNQLVSCIHANLSRDQPPSEVAPWVVATDKPSAAGKNAGAIGANDKAEERLKREVMSLHARDRRRVKTVKADLTTRPEGGLREMQDYRYELAVRPPQDSSSSSQGTGSLPKSNWDLETRRKYVQPLAAETLEFPSQADMQNRIEPICYDEGLIGGAQGALQACAELMEQATEVYLKSILCELQAHTRANGVDCIQTARFRRQLRKEESEAERGVIQRNAAGLLPVEFEVQAKREPLSDFDLRLALELRDSLVLHETFLAEKVRLNRFPDPVGRSSDVNGNGPFVKPAINGPVPNGVSMEDDLDAAWQGGSRAEQDGLMGVLDDCLAVG